MGIQIKEFEDQFQIKGNAEELRALGEAMILKSKLGDNFICLIKNENKPVSLEVENNEWICHDCRHLENKGTICDFFTCLKACSGEVPEVNKCDEFERL